MPGDLEFDMDGALGDISEGLGFASGGASDDINLEVDHDDTTLNNGAGGSGTGTTSPADGAVTPPAGQSAATTPVDPAATVPPALTAPVTWRQEAKAVWANLPIEAQKEVLKREQDIMQGIESYKEHAAFGRSLKSVMDPYIPVLSAAGLDPVKQVGNLLQAHVALSTGSPEQKAAFFRAIAQDYKVDLNQLAIEAPYVDPTVQALQTQLNAVQSKLSSDEQAKLADKRAAYEREITQFASDPKNSHFETVAPQMARLIQSGVAATLQEAYEQAVWANPVTRAAEVQRQQAETAAAAKAEAEARAAAARKATAANVKARPRSGTAAGPSGTMDDTLKETLAAIQSRS